MKKRPAALGKEQPVIFLFFVVDKEIRVDLCGQICYTVT
jgi:hypothetical protein